MYWFCAMITGILPARRGRASLRSWSSDVEFDSIENAADWYGRDDGPLSCCAAHQGEWCFVDRSDTVGQRGCRGGSLRVCWTWQRAAGRRLPALPATARRASCAA